MIITLLMAPKIALSCMCFSTPLDVDGSTDGYEAVFIGELIGIDRTEVIFSETKDTFPVEINSYVLERSFKGSASVGDTVSIYQFGIGCTNSRAAMHLKSRFIVGAFRNRVKAEDWPNMGKYLQASLCTLSISEYDEPSYSDGISILQKKSNMTIEKEFMDSYVMPLVSILVLGSIIFVAYLTRSVGD